MKTSKILSATLLTIALLISQVGSAFAVSAVPDEADKQHPVAVELAEYFKDITDYDTIMQAHAGEGDFEIVGSTGFGVISQALWLTVDLESEFPEFTTDEIFQMVLDAKENNDFSEFEALFEEGTPQNWGQFRKAVKALSDPDEGKKNNLGTVMSQNNEEHGNNGGGGGQDQGGGGGQNHSGGGGQNHGGGGGQGQGGGQGHGGGQGNGHLKP